MSNERTVVTERMKERMIINKLNSKLNDI